jgi:branched-chain amino acid transport system ATP-binding protein
METGTFLLETNHLSVGYGKIAILSELNLTLRSGEIVAILGRNGAGKTTLLHTIAGLLGKLAGDVKINGSSTNEPLFKLARQGLGLVPETRGIVNRLTVGENLRLCKGDNDIALDLFPELKELYGRKAGLLSGGEQQMLAIGRALSMSPQILLIDELSLGLAPKVIVRLLDALQSAVKRTNTGVLLVEQHLNTALSVADRAYVIGGGGVRMDDTSESLKSRIPEIEATYLE